MVEALRDYLCAPQKGSLEQEVLDRIVEEYPWFVTARLLRMRLSGASDPMLQLRLMFSSPVEMPLRRPGGEDAEELGKGVCEAEMIDRFLNQSDHRIHPGTTCSGADISLDSVAEDPDLISEELAEIYLRQGLKSKAKAVYVKLSLLYPKKSVYFAEIIHRIDASEV